jgi:hypothetical protein
MRHKKMILILKENYLFWRGIEPPMHLHPPFGIMFWERMKG